MFNYDAFKKIMQENGHSVHKQGKYVTVEPAAVAEGYGSAYAILPREFVDFLDLVNWDHYNTVVYSAKFKIKEVK